MIVSVAPAVGAVVDALQRRGADFHLNVLQDRVTLSAEAGAEPVVVLDGEGLSLRLAPDQVQRLLLACPAGQPHQATRGERWVRFGESSLADAQVRTFVVMFALIALAAAGGSDLGEPLAADELVEAIIHSVRWADGQQDIADSLGRRPAGHG